MLLIGSGLGLIGHAPPVAPERVRVEFPGSAAAGPIDPVARTPRPGAVAAPGLSRA